MAWNVFKLCTALRALGSIMIAVVVGVVTLTYYAVVLVYYGPSLVLGGTDSLIAILVLIPFHFLLAMLLWCYFATIVTDPGGVPSDWRPPIDEEIGDSVPLVGSEPSFSDPHLENQRARFCRKCNQFKPPRCHHCSVCARCILKMDHHCVWVVNCVGARNYKFFLLFLFYTLLETTVVVISLLRVFLKFLGDGEFSGSPAAISTTFITFVLNLSFALSLLGMLIIHSGLVISNKTTIEVFEKGTDSNSKWFYDVGTRRNFEQVFGKDKRYWAIPLFSGEDMNLKRLDFAGHVDEPAANS